MSYVFGIDLGTTYSCISYIDSYGKPIVLKNSEGDHTTPSVVFVESSENIVVGMEAKRTVEVEPEKTVQFIKRKMGKENDKVTLNGIQYSAPEISAYILKKITSDANEELRQTGVLQQGEAIKDVVITCPAYFGMNERQATKTAGELAGLNVLNIINEPTAAAISYGVSGTEKNEKVLVYDLGGGTFDITVMNISGNDISVVCTGGDDQLGGKDWDEALMDYVVQRYQEEMGEDLTEDPEVISALYVDVETWKKSLTTREKVNISVNGPAGRFREELTRSKYEELTKSLLDRTKNLLDEILETAGKQQCSIAQLDKILLVGGSSRMPQVAEMLKRDYGVMPILADPDEAVAKGAAIYAGNEKAYNDFVSIEAAKSGKTVEQIKEENLRSGEMDRKFALSSNASLGMCKRLNINNVLSRTYGVEVRDRYEKKDGISNLLYINSSLPVTKAEKYQTSVNNQSSVMIKIYESRSMEEWIDIDGRKPVAMCEMKFKRSVPEGTLIDLSMSLDNAGILHLYAEEELYHSVLDTTFELSLQMTEEELRSASSRMSSATVE